MTLGICVLISWATVVAFALAPKKLSEPEAILLFFVNIIFEVSTMTVLSLNLHLFESSRDVEKSIADLVMRFVAYPVGMLLATNVLLVCNRFRWLAAAAAIGGLTACHCLLRALGVLRFIHWNLALSATVFAAYLAFSFGMAWIIVHIISEKGTTGRDHV